MEWKPADGEYFANLNHHVAHEKELHLTAADGGPLAVCPPYERQGGEDGEEGKDYDADVAQVAVVTAERNAGQDAAAEMIKTIWAAGWRLKEDVAHGQSRVAAEVVEVAIVGRRHVGSSLGAGHLYCKQDAAFQSSKRW